MKQKLCIIIHGFSGNPWEVEPLGQFLEQLGYEVMTPLLPGHSLNHKRMKKATALDWIQSTEEIIRQAMDENKEIHMIGFSMGAMIASIIGSRFQLSTLVLLSPAVYVFSPNLIKTKLVHFFPTAKGNRSFSDSTIFENQSFIRTVPISNFIQFQKVVRQAKKIFQHISIPICIIHGQKDETVDPKGAKWIFRTVSSREKELHYLPRSKHHICRDCEADTVNQLVLSFFKKYD